jgi:predicted DNA-binding helix-hairpin-helix protein
MMTTACERNCFYCAFRAGRSRMERITFQPDEMAQGFDRIQRAKLVDGLFLSSGIINGGPTAQDKIIDTAEILRRKYSYRGYIHLKIMPGAEYEQIRRAMQLADRVSINLEGATAQRLAMLAPKKDFWNELVQRLMWVEEIRRNERVRASSVTQFVVGAVGDTDLELLSLSEKLYHQARISRAYYMAFNPVAQTPFEDRLAVPPQRAYRLYQASFLLRDYNWNTEDLGFQDDQNLRLDVDPKQAWADLNLRHAPVELNLADRETLLRVPGIGPKSVDRILAARREGTFTELAQLAQIGVPSPGKAAPYVLLAGRRPLHQMGLF